MNLSGLVSLSNHCRITDCVCVRACVTTNNVLGTVSRRKVTATLPKLTVVYRKRAQRVCRVCFTRKSAQSTTETKN